MKRRLHSLIATTALLLTVCPTQGSTIFWGSLFNDVLVDSAGNALDASYSFELGTFVPGFTPTSENLPDWGANWKTFDAVQDGAGWSPGDQFVEGTVNHTLTGGSDSGAAVPTDTFAQGSQAYLWVYNSKDYATTSEWALLYDDAGATAVNIYGDWLFPDPALEFDSFDWQFRDLDVAIFGGVNGAQGAGAYSAEPVPAGPEGYYVQTHTVPEPGSALLVLVAGMLGLNLGHRRRR